MVNDNHGVLNEEDGSMDKIASGISYFDSLGNTIKIANGDMFQGTYVSSSLKGLPMLEALNLLEFDAFVVGNHEFDWGFDEMKKYKDGDETNGEANFPFLGANIYDKRTREMVDWLEPYTVVDFDEVKVGIIGIIGQVESSIMASHVADYEFVDARNIVKDLAIELRTVEDCDVVIVASHGDDDRLNYDLVEYDGTSKIDAIFTGHSHTPTDEEISRGDGSKVRVLQNGGYGESFALLTLKFDEQGNLKDTDGGLYPTYQFESEGILSPVFEKYAEKIAVGNEVLLTIDQSVSRQEIGIEIAHSMFLKYGVDCAIINTGGVRTSVEAGDVTYADLFQVLPFENEVYIVRMSALEMVEFISNTSVYYWMLNNIDIDGEYQMAIVDYVYLSDSFAPYRKDDYIDTNDLIRDVFIDYILLYA